MEREKIPLPEGAGAQFIAPSDLTAILLEPFDYDWKRETDGRIIWQPTLVYGRNWVGKRIFHFPWCKELFEFLDWLKKEHGWYIFASWGPFCNAQKRIGRLAHLDLLRYYNLGLWGYVWAGILTDVGELGEFWSASEGSGADGAYGLSFGRTGFVIPMGRPTNRDSAHSVRCVS